MAQMVILMYGFIFILIIIRPLMGCWSLKVFSDVQGKKGLMYLNALWVHRLRRILIVFNQTYGRFDSILLESLFLPVFFKRIKLVWLLVESRCYPHLTWMA